MGANLTVDVEFFVNNERAVALEFINVDAYIKPHLDNFIFKIEILEL